MTARTEGKGILRSSVQPDVSVRYSLLTGHGDERAGSRGVLQGDGDALILAALSASQALILEDGTAVDISITLAEGDGSGRFEVKAMRSWH